MTDTPDQTRSMTIPRLRLLKSAAEIAASPPLAVAYQHSVFCQTGLPYRNPGDQTRAWELWQGNVGLSVEAGRVADTKNRTFVDLGLPYGPKPRLILAYLNTQAIRTQSPEVDVGSSLTAFVRRIKLAQKGQNIRLIKDQLARLSAATVRLSVGDDTRTYQVNAQIVTAFDLWFPKDARQRVLWPSTVRLSEEYFVSLAKHGVPLDERAIAGLAHSAMGLDIYAWLAQRLHRIKPGRPQLVPWSSLKAQFGWHYERMSNFRRNFLTTLKLVAAHYPEAKIEIDRVKGLALHRSAPPVAKQLHALPAG